MASDPDSSPAASFLDQLINSRNRDLSVFLPLILGFSTPSRRESSADDDEDQDSEQTRGRIVLINPLTQGMIVIESNRSLEDMIRDFASKEGPKPATKASIEAMGRVVIGEEDREKECSICLEEWEIAEEAREMPCKHKYHSKCIEKWLEIHGNCPVCRFEMPVDEDGVERKVASDEERGGEREIWVSFAFNGRSRDSTPPPPPAATAASDDSSVGDD